MSRAALLIALLLAFLLSLTWALTTIPQGAAGSRQPGAPFTPAFDAEDVTHIQWDDRDRPMELRRRADHTWSLTLSHADAPWRLERAPVDAALAALANTSLTPATRPTESSAAGSSMRISTPRGPIEFAVLPPVGGRTPVFIDPPARWCTAPPDAFALLAPDAVLALRSRAALPGVSVNAARITITPPRADRIVLWREGARWWLADPTAAPADPHAVDRLLSLLASLRFSSLRPSDAPSPEPERSLLTILVEASVYDDAEQRSYFESESLLLYELADAPRAVHAARAEQAPTYPLEPAALSTIPTDAAMLVHPFATIVPPHSVAGINIDFIHPPVTRRIRREIDGWTLADRLPDEPVPAAHPTDAARADALLRFLLETRPARILIEHARHDEQPLARITILDVADHVLDELTLVRTVHSPDAPDGSDIPATRSDKVLRVFPLSTATPDLLIP